VHEKDSQEVRGERGERKLKELSLTYVGNTRPKRLSPLLPYLL
jgi:hypothetical protein